MAKDEANDAKGEEYQFEIPDFDEEAFIHKEMTSFRTTAVLFAWGILAALLSWGIFVAVDGAKTAWYLGLAVVIGFLYALRIVYPKLNIDVAHFKRREWMGTGFLLFFTWLAFFILFANPPISDFADPHIAAYETPSVQQVGGDVVLDLFATDNGNIDHIEFALMQGSTVLAGADDLIYNGGGHYQYTIQNATGGTYSYTFKAVDAKGNEAMLGGEAKVSQTALQVILPNGGTIGPNNNLLVKTQMPACTDSQRRDGGECIHRVYANIGEGLNLIYEDTEGWKATELFAGWETGSNTFDIIAETQTQFHGAITIDNTELRAGPFTVEAPGNGDFSFEVTDVASVPPAYRQTPGFELVFLLVGLVGLTVLRRK